jgi:molybdate-binding protein
VEELFQLAPEAPAATPVAHANVIGGGEHFRGTQLELCRVGGRLVAVPAVPVPWHLAASDAVLVDPERSTVQLLREESADRLLIAGCDPAASVLARHMARAHAGVVSAPVNSSAALGLLREGLVHVAGTHLSDDEVKGAVPQLPGVRVAVFAFASWEEGLVVGRGNPKRIRAVEDLARRGVRLANREPGSGSRQLLDAQLQAAGIAARKVGGYKDTAAAGHLAAVWRVYAGLADCCVATESAARAFGMDFVALTSERYRLVIRREHLALEAVQRLLDVLGQAGFRRELETLCGYDTRETGERVA